MVVGELLGNDTVNCGISPQVSVVACHWLDEPVVVGSSHHEVADVDKIAPVIQKADVLALGGNQKLASFPVLKSTP